MMKDLLRIIGSASIIAGTMLYFSIDVKYEDESENSRLKTEIKTLQSDFKMATEELANLQLTIKESEAPSQEKVEDAESDSDSLTSDVSDTTIVFIEPGMNSTRVAHELAKAGIIKDASTFEIYLAKNKLAGKIQIGEYKLHPSMSNEEIIKMITSSK